MVTVSQIWEGRMHNATLLSGDVGAAYFFVRYGRDGRAVLMSSPSREKPGTWNR